MTWQYYLEEINYANRKLATGSCLGIALNLPLNMVKVSPDLHVSPKISVLRSLKTPEEKIKEVKLKIKLNRNKRD